MMNSEKVILPVLVGVAAALVVGSVFVAGVMVGWLLLG